MVFPELLSSTPLIAVISYTIILITIFIRRGPQERLVRYLLAFLFTSLAWEFLLFFAPAISFPPNLPAIGLLITTTLLGVITAVYADWSHPRVWILLGTLGTVTTFLVNLLAPDQTLATTSTRMNVLTVGDLAAIISWTVLSGYLLIRTWLDYRHTSLPWHANRLLYWAIALLIIFAGEGVMFTSNITLIVAGQIMRFVGVVAIAYAGSAHRVFDVRTRTLNVFTFFVITAVSAAPLVALILFVQFSIENTRLLLALTVTTVVASFFLYQPFQSFIERIVYHYLPSQAIDTRFVVRNYSQSIYQTLEVQQLVMVISNTLNDLFDTNRVALCLVTVDENSFDVDVIPGIGLMARHSFQFERDSLFIQTLSQRRQPLLQYDIDFGPQYDNLSPEERGWFKEMGMEVYVPISTSTNLEGLIAIGPKKSGVPYYSGELELMQILADQTVIALQNARLYSELSIQNDRVRHLNMDLVHQNERLEIMDKVKADFITIASHELRTPLTQVKGYADILAAMNESQALTPKQTGEILSHINRAVGRLETLITAMLDASQLDAEGVQLSFMDTSLDTVVRIALEPMSQAAKERRILINTDLKSIPSLRADFKRLVQAFSNLIGNAIKYTPDHGSITISAMLVPNQEDDEEFVEVLVADTGIGIDPQYHELIFEKFFRIGDPQLHSTGTTKFKGAGPGLGLTIAKGVVEAHGGRIWVESEGEDEERLPGSCFHLILPLHPEEPERATNGSKPQTTEKRPAWLVG